MPNANLLVVGAGPTGLVLALGLARPGVQVRLIDANAQAGTTSRALAVQARTLELYEPLDQAAPVVQRGHRVAARLPFSTIGDHLTRYPFLQISPQDEHERLLIERLGDAFREHPGRLYA
ncbi:MAG TPA: FAD-dependent oxidoreductase [Steroidobacteraceae bacterium]|nr:FAD-dependent oxidoreductase [Steroidobacteraceae bacterium]